MQIDRSDIIGYVSWGLVSGLLLILAVIGGALMLRIPSPESVARIFMPYLGIEVEEVSGLLQALIGGQVSFLAILFSAIFIVSQLVSNRYALEFGSVVFRIKLVKFVLIFGSFSIVVDTFGFLMIGVFSSFELLLFSLSAILLSTVLFVSLYPLVRSVISQMNPLGVLELYTRQIKPPYYIQQSLEYVKDWKRSNHPLEPLYQFIKSALENGELSNAERAIEKLFKKSTDTYQSIPPLEEEMKWLNPERGFTPEIEYNFDLRMGEFYRKSALFHPLLDNYATSIVEISTSSGYSNIIVHTISEISKFTKIMVKNRDSEMLSICMSTIHGNLLTKAVSQSSPSDEILFRKTTESISSIYWFSFSNLQIVNSKLGVPSGEVFDPFAIAGGKNHQGLAGIYRNAVMNYMGSISPNEIAEDETLREILKHPLNKYSEFEENNSEAYRGVANIPDNASLIEQDTRWTPMGRDDLPEDPDQWPEHQPILRQFRLTWPIVSFQNDIMWLTDTYFSESDYPSRIVLNRGLFDCWVDSTVECMNGHLQNLGETMMELTLLMFAEIQSQVIDKLNDSSEEHLSDITEDMESRKVYESIPSDVRDELARLYSYNKMITLYCIYLHKKCGREDVDQAIDRLSMAEDLDFLEQYRQEYPSTDFWVRFAGEDPEDLDKRLQFISSLGENANEFDIGEILRQIRFLRNTAEVKTGD